MEFYFCAARALGSPAVPGKVFRGPSTVNGETTRVDPTGSEDLGERNRLSTTRLDPTRSEDSAEWSFIFVRLGPWGPPLPPERSLRDLPAGGRRAPLKHNFSIVSSLLDASEPV